MSLLHDGVDVPLPIGVDPAFRAYLARPGASTEAAPALLSPLLPAGAAADHQQQHGSNTAALSAYKSSYASSNSSSHHQLSCVGGREEEEEHMIPSPCISTYVSTSIIAAIFRRRCSLYVLYLIALGCAALTAAEIVWPGRGDTWFQGELVRAALPTDFPRASTFVLRNFLQQHERCGGVWWDGGYM
jgi:hypothetical protein